jgi:hypothetical protein
VSAGGATLARTKERRRKAGLKGGLKEYTPWRAIKLIMAIIVRRINISVRMVRTAF